MKLLSIKKTLVLQFASLLLFTVATYAQKGMNVQIVVSPGMSMGGKFEVPENPQSLDPGWVALKKTFTFGMDAGVTFGYNFTEKVGVNLGLLYSKQGQHYKDYTWTIGKDNATWKRKVALNYLKLPLRVNYTINPEQKISFTASAGFYLSFLLGYKDENSATASDGSSFTATAKGDTYTQTYGSDTESAAFINGNPYKSTDFGGLISVGLQFKLSEKIVIPVGLIYQVGFVDIKNKACQYTQSSSNDAELFWQNSDNDSPNATLSYHNSSLELLIGLKINL
jgi:hypothetical protein